MSRPFHRYQQNTGIFALNIISHVYPLPTAVDSLFPTGSWQSNVVPLTSVFLGMKANDLTVNPNPNPTITQSPLPTCKQNCTVTGVPPEVYQWHPYDSVGVFTAATVVKIINTISN